MALIDLAERIWQRLPRRVQGRVLYLTQDHFLLGVVGIIRDDRSRVLLLEHRFRTDPWGLPGGFLKGGESPAEGLEREIHEETGLVVRAEPQIWHTLFSAGGRYATLTLTGEVVSGSLSYGLELKGGGFFEPDEIPAQTHAAHAELIRRWADTTIADPRSAS